MLKIAVCVKSVLLESLGDGCTSPSRTIQNSGMNPFDLYALECAFSLSPQQAREISVFSMGTAKPAEAVLREAAKLGANQLYAISDPLFAGSDTYVTAKILSRALEQTGPFDLILCGERAIDGETGQVPGELAARQKATYVTAVEEIAQCDANGLQLICRTDEGSARVETAYPAVLGISCGIRNVGHPVMPSLKQLRQAQGIPITVLNSVTLGFSASEVGHSGSLTKVVRSVRPEWDRQCVFCANIPQGIRQIRSILGACTNGDCL